MSLSNDIRVLGRINPEEEDGLLRSDDFQRVWTLMNKHREKARDIELKNLKKSRRKKLEDLELEEYRELVMQINQKEEDIDNDILSEVCGALKIDE